jgi:hypothetical protein
VNFNKVKSIYFLSCIILGLIIFSPTLFLVTPLPEGEKFSELWLLGSESVNLNNLVNISTNKSYKVILGVANNMKSFESYIVNVKLLNQSDPLPNRSTGFPSQLNSVFEYRLFIENNQTIEREFVFSVDNILFADNFCRISSLSINGLEVTVDKIITWDAIYNNYPGQFLFELWIYNSEISSFQYHNRSVWFWFNLTTKGDL